MNIEEIIIPKNDFIVSQHNNLIMANYDMSALEQKIFLILLSTIKKEDTEINTTSFRVTDLSALMNITPQYLYRDLKKACKSIMSKIIEVSNPITGEWELINIIPKAKYHSKQGQVTFSLNKDAYPYLLQLKKMFTFFRLENILPLESKYSIRIYQQVKSAMYIGSYTISLEDFKKKLMITKKSYNQFSNINLKILNPSIKEINEKTDVSVSIKLIKTGRKVSHIKFCINPQKTVSFTNSNKTHKYFDYDYNKLEDGLLGYSDYSVRDVLKKRYE